MELMRRSSIQKKSLKLCNSIPPTSSSNV
jgi:hypothetical protein